MLRWVTNRLNNFNFVVDYCNRNLRCLNHCCFIHNLFAVVDLIDALSLNFESLNLTADFGSIQLRVDVSDVPPDVVLSMANDFVAQHALEFHVSVYFLVSLEYSLIRKLFEADIALDQRLVLSMDCLVNL